MEASDVFSEDFKGSQLRYMGSNGVLGGFRRHFGKVQGIFGEFQRCSSGVTMAFSVVSVACGSQVVTWNLKGLKEIPKTFQKVSKDFCRVS